MKQCALKLGLVILWAGCLVATATARPKANVKTVINRAETPDRVSETLILPYAFSTESMGLNLGIGGMRRGFYQEQMTIGGTAFGGDVSQGVMLGLWNFRVPGSRRFYFSTNGFLGYFPDQQAYTSVGGNFTPAGATRAGSNDSSSDDFLGADGSSNWWDMKLEYSLPIGATRDSGRVKYQLAGGLLVSEPSGGEEWNPLTSGATVLVARQFNRFQTFEFPEDEGGELDGTIHAVEFGLLYDNTDFSVNPSTGSRQYFSVSHDAGWLDSDKQWTFMELDISKYFSFGESKYAHQRILALDFWTGYSPSWKQEFDENGGSTVTDNAPYNEGATLGGFYRMRGYDQNRFHDKAAIYGTAEYRYTMKYNPIENVKWLKFLKLDWFQLVGYVEAGRVGSKYTANELLKDVKTDVGFSLRALTAGVVVRADVATSDEGTSVWVMIDHPF
ncbi:MAG: BamA/TamA family outer membrane protein [Proteobacteria bacterium]|nr:BamA/TamA family outer membrane protein [Pseudomonadota bacterium]